MESSLHVPTLRTGISELVKKDLQHRQIRTCCQMLPELTTGLGCIPDRVGVCDGSIIQVLRSCGKESDSGKMNKQPSGNRQWCCCWAIPSGWYCFCLGLLTCSDLVPCYGMKKKHFPLSSTVRQGKESWEFGMFVCLRPTIFWHKWWTQHHLHTCSIPEWALKTLSKNFLCPAFALPTAV